MTRCKNCSYNYQLKSSAYNQTGQGYEVQLAAYNAMTNHLRRVLLAKSVVDCGKGDKRVSNTRSRAKTPICKRERNIVGQSLSDKLINRLAYDTRHHPHEVANMSWVSSAAKYGSRKNTVRSNSTDSSEDLSLRDHRRTLKTYGDKFRAEFAARSSSPRQSDKGLRKKHRTGFEEPVDSSGDSDDSADVKKKLGKSSRKEEKRLRGAIQSTRSGSDISFPRTPEFLAISTTNVEQSERFNDVSVYVKFVYDITKEVMEKGYYSDKEIERVLKKHFERNLGRLNESKMLREIRSLKKALDIKYDSEEEDEEDADGFVIKSKLRSSEKLKVDKRVAINAEIPSLHDLRVLKTINKSEAVDPSKEIIVTKEDILSTLLEMDFNPEKAEEVCKNLENRSKEVCLSQKNRLSTAKEDEEYIEESRSEAIELRESNDCEETGLGSSPKSKKRDSKLSRGEKVSSLPRESLKKLEDADNDGTELEEMKNNSDTDSQFLVLNRDQKGKKDSSISEGSGVPISTKKIIKEEEKPGKDSNIDKPNQSDTDKGVETDVDYSTEKRQSNSSPESQNSEKKSSRLE